MDIGQSSFTEFTREISTPGESSWAALSDTVDGKHHGHSQIDSPLVDARPRKRRRVASNEAVATQLADTCVDYHSRPSHSRSNSSIKTPNLASDNRSQELCQTCRKCKSNHQCSRCATPTCSVCARTCTTGATSTPPTPLLCYSATPSPGPVLSQLPDDSLDSFEALDIDDLGARLVSATTSKRRSSTSHSGRNESSSTDAFQWEEPSAGGCGRVVCQSCAVEDSDSHESTCLDCLDGFEYPS